MSLRTSQHSNLAIRTAGCTAGASARRSGTAGFTLIELAMVVLIICIVTAVVLPHFLPAIAFGELEGAARHLGNFGRAAIARAAMSKEPLIFRFDLDNQQYWLVETVKVETEEGEDAQSDGNLMDQYHASQGRRGQVSKLFKDNKDGGGFFDNNKRSQDLVSQVPSLEGLFGDLPDEQQEQAERMKERFDRYVQLQIMARAENVSQDGILSDIGPLFDKKFTLDLHDKETEEREVLDDILARTTLPAGVWLDSVDVGSEGHSKGMVEIEISPLGLTEPVVFYLRNDDGDFYTVEWDAITGGAHLYRGKAK